MELLSILLLIFVAFFLFLLMLLVVLHSVIFAWIKSKKTEYPLSFFQILGFYLKRLDLDKMIEVNNIINKHSLKTSLSEAEVFILEGRYPEDLLNSEKEKNINEIDFNDIKST